MTRPLRIQYEGIVERVVDLVCKEYGVTEEKVLVDKNRGERIEARDASIYLLWCYSSIGFRQIGKSIPV